MNYRSDGFGGTQMEMSSTSDQGWTYGSFGSSCSTSGMLVNHRTGLSYGPLYQAITMIADDLALLPVEVFKEDSDGKKSKDENHPISKIWNTQANRDMLAYDVRETLLGWTLLHGNGVGVIEWNGDRPVGVWPIAPGSVSLHRIEPESRQPELPDTYLYRYSMPGGQSGWLFQHEVFHVRYFGDARWGYSPLWLFKDMIGNGMAMEYFQGSSFSNGARPSGVLKKNYGAGIPTKLSPEARANLRREWDEMHSGSGNAGKVAILTDGLEFEAISQSNSDAQMLDSMKYSREQIAAIYKIPPHKLGATASLTFNNVQEQNRSYAQQCLMPLARKFEEECWVKLTSNREKQRQRTTIDLDFSEFLKPDVATRVQQTIAYRQWGVMSANDVRKIEGWEDIGEQGDIYMVPGNMADAETREPFSQAPEAEPDPELPQEEAPEADSTSANEAMLAFARHAMHNRQALEIKDLKNGINRKQPFTQFCSAYYENKFVDKCLEPLECLAAVPGFISGPEMESVISAYAAESLAMVEKCTDKDDLINVFAGFPARIEKYVMRLRVV